MHGKVCRGSVGGQDGDGIGSPKPVTVYNTCVWLLAGWERVRGWLVGLALVLRVCFRVCALSSVDFCDLLLKLDN